MLWSIPYIAFKHPTTIGWPLFPKKLAKDDFLCYCNAPPTTVGYSWIMFEHYLDLGLKHPRALNEVFQLGYINDCLVLIHKGCFCSSFRWSKVAKANIPLQYDIKNKNKHVSIKQKLQNMVETWQKNIEKCVSKLHE
jgi:hypothetical protein